jgi:hypothetical protein
MEAKLDVLLGRVIKIKTMMNEQVEGTIYTLDKVTNCLVLDILFIIINIEYFTLYILNQYKYTAQVKIVNIIHFAYSRYRT